MHTDAQFTSLHCHYQPGRFLSITCGDEGNRQTVRFVSRSSVSSQSGYPAWNSRAQQNWTRIHQSAEKQCSFPLAHTCGLTFPTFAPYVRQFVQHLSIRWALTRQLQARKQCWCSSLLLTDSTAGPLLTWGASLPELFFHSIKLQNRKQQCAVRLFHTGKLAAAVHCCDCSSSPGYFQEYFKLHFRKCEWCHEYILQGRVARCFAKRSARSQSIFHGDQNRHSAISVHHFCFTSISELLFANCQRAPCKSTRHFPFHLCVAGSGSAPICLWLFSIFLGRVQAWTQAESKKEGGERGEVNEDG